MTCKQCIHKKVCPHLKDTDAERCKQYIDKENVEEVVRCENCVYWDYGRCEGIENGLIYEKTHPYDYCSYAKKG